MEREREEQPQNDPEAMKNLTRVQVRILQYCALQIAICFLLSDFRIGFCIRTVTKSFLLNRTLNIKLK